jgi:eukaryotic-like serine/threonine-protein kinase
MSAGEPSSSPVRRVGRYALHSEIASGGMATVYLGRQRGQAGFARTVAIKRLHPQHAKEPEFVSMFLDEARLAARIRHPNVVPTLDVVATDGELFLVMEYVQGESLARLLRASRQRKESAPTRVVAAIVADVLHGLHAAHEATSEKGEPLGLVHRDVSPHNILVGADGVARVVDFGVAKAAGRIQTTREGQIKGKIAYMAPEQITGTVTRRTDVYAASVVLWEALTGKRLFAGENDGSVMHQVIHAQVVPPGEHVPGLDPAWDEIVLRGLQRDEQLRYQTAREMALDIESRLTLARATEVAAWVESLAHESLAKRAGEVTAIESASDVDVLPDATETDGSDPAAGASTGTRAKVAPAPVLAVQDRPGAGESTASRLSAVSWPLHTSPGKGRGSRIAIAALGASAAVVVTWALMSSRPAPVVQQPAAFSATAGPPAPVATGEPAPAAPSAVPLASAATAVTAPSSSAPLASARLGSTAPPRMPKVPRAKTDPATAPTKDPTLGSVLDSRR